MLRASIRVRPVALAIRSISTKPTISDFDFNAACVAIENLRQNLLDKHRYNTAAEDIAAWHLSGNTALGAYAISNDSGKAKVLRTLLVSMAADCKLLCENPALLADASHEMNNRIITNNRRIYSSGRLFFDEPQAPVDEHELTR